MQLLWPTRLNPAPSVVTRLGRAIFWLGYGLAALLAYSAVANAGPDGYWVVPAFAAGLFALGGRITRYVLSAE